MSDPDLPVELVDDYIGLAQVPVPPLVAAGLDKGVLSCFLPRPMSLARSSRPPVHFRKCNVPGKWLGKQGMYFENVVCVSEERVY